MAIDLVTFKAHAIVVDDADDALCQRLINAAKKHTENQLGLALDAVTFPTGVPGDLEQAVFMLAAHWYENREASIAGMTINTVPFGYEDIIRENRVYTYG